MQRTLKILRAKSVKTYEKSAPCIGTVHPNVRTLPWAWLREEHNKDSPALMTRK